VFAFLEIRHIEDQRLKCRIASPAFVCRRFLFFGIHPFDRRQAAETLVRATGVEPHGVIFKLPSHRGSGERYDKPSGALGFKRAEEPLQDSDAAVFSDCAVAWLDVPSLAPLFKCHTPELSAFVGDDIFRRLTDSPDQAVEKRCDLARCRRRFEYSETDDTACAMIYGTSHPPAKRPALNHGHWQPGNPETGLCGNNRQVDMPNMVGVIGGNSVARWFEEMVVRIWLIVDV